MLDELELDDPGCLDPCWSFVLQDYEDDFSWNPFTIVRTRVEIWKERREQRARQKKGESWSLYQPKPMVRSNSLLRMRSYKPFQRHKKY